MNLGRKPTFSILEICSNLGNYEIFNNFVFAMFDIYRFIFFEHHQLAIVATVLIYQSIADVY